MSKLTELLGNPKLTILLSLGNRILSLMSDDVKAAISSAIDRIEETADATPNKVDDVLVLVLQLRKYPELMHLVADMIDRWTEHAEETPGKLDDILAKLVSLVEAALTTEAN